MPVKYDDFVKAPNKEVEWTPKRVRELIKCKDNLIYFATHYIKVAHQEHGIMVMEPRDYQIDLWNKFIKYNRNIVLMSRQSGKSASVSAYVLWFAIFNDNKNIGIVSNKEKAAKQFLMRLKDCYLRLPEWMKPGVTQWAETSVRFENGTYLQIAATSGDSFRGEPLALLICDEFAAVEPWKAQEFWASVYPTVSASKTAKVIIISTAKGMHNQFHKIWVGATNKTNSFVHTKYDWRVVPGRTEEWAQEEKGNIGTIQFNQEFNCVGSDTEITILNNNVIETITIGELYDILSRNEG